MKESKWIAVFCGSQLGCHSEYGTAARLLGEKIAKRGWGLLYGGSSLGLMGEVSSAAHLMGGQVKGFIPQALAGDDNLGVGIIDVVDTMHQRQALIHELADAYIALPGGYSTIE